MEGLLSTGPTPSSLEVCKLNFWGGSIELDHLSQTVRPRDLKFLENVPHPLLIMCHMSCVMCHKSHVTIHVSHVMYHVSRVVCHLKKYVEEKYINISVNKK